VLAPAAQAWPTLTARFRSVTVAPVLVSAMETPRAGGVGSGVNQTPAGLPVPVAPSFTAMGLEFSQPADSVTLKPSAAARRYLERHHLTRLRVAIDSAGAAKARSTLKLER
jgi:hypothetical protein